MNESLTALQGWEIAGCSRARVSHIQHMGRIWPTKAFIVAPEGILNKLKPSDISSALHRLIPQVFCQYLVYKIGKIQ